MTEEELDALLGVPKHALSCSRCAYTTRPFYSLPMARERLTEHIRWMHTNVQRAMAADDSKGAR